MLFKNLNFKNKDDLTAHQKASRRIAIFTVMVGLVLVMGLFGWFPSNAISILSPLNGGIMWFAIAAVVFCIINLFNKDKVPGEVEFDNKSYFALLFTLGMGVGIMIYGFNEAPSLAGYDTVRNPIGLVINHWTIIPWCLYVTFAILEIYDAKYKFLPEWLRTFKTYLYGIMMMLGIATSFALGVNQISGSLDHIYHINVPNYALVVLLGAAVTVSLLRGIHKGMKVFAKASMYLLYAFIVVLAIAAPFDTMQVGVKAIGSFFTDFFHNNVYQGTAVQKDWTVYYWIWWISWCAFCAPFIHTISKGRTIRSMVGWTVIMPTILSAVYMILGNNFGMHLLNKGTAIAEIPYEAISIHWILPVFFIIMMSMFYITSSDSQSFAMDTLISKGSHTPIVYRKILWVFLEVVFTTVLLLAGGGTISAIQGLSFLATPLMILFAIVCVIMIVYKMCKKEIPVKFGNKN